MAKPRRFWSSRKGHGEGITFLRNHIGHTGAECLIWPLGKDNHGYGLVAVEGKVRKASRIMCIMAHGEPPSPLHEAAHSCGNGNGGCVHPEHLSWKTGSENQLDSIKHGTFGKKPGTPKYKLTAELAEQIRGLKGTKTQKEIAAMFGVSAENVGKIFRGLIWQPGVLRHRVLVAADIETIKSLSGIKTQKEIAAQLGISARSVGWVQQGKSYKHLSQSCRL